MTAPRRAAVCRDTTYCTHAYARAHMRARTRARTDGWRNGMCRDTSRHTGAAPLGAKWIGTQHDDTTRITAARATGSSLTPTCTAAPREARIKNAVAIQQGLTRDIGLGMTSWVRPARLGRRVVATAIGRADD